jgi:hypothetical protein
VHFGEFSNTRADEAIVERLAVIDFCDAAAEWGSTVPIPEREAERMIELADQRRIADLEERRAEREERPHYEVLRIEPVLEDILILNRSVADEVVAGSRRCAVSDGRSGDHEELS